MRGNKVCMFKDPHRMCNNLCQLPKQRFCHELLFEIMTHLIGKYKKNVPSSQLPLYFVLSNNHNLAKANANVAQLQLHIYVFVFICLDINCARFIGSYLFNISFVLSSTLKRCSLKCFFSRCIGISYSGSYYHCRSWWDI